MGRPDIQLLKKNQSHMCKLRTLELPAACVVRLWDLAYSNQQHTSTYFLGLAPVIIRCSWFSCMAKLPQEHGHSELAVMRGDLNLRKNEWDL